jgi:hypothetical protein
MGEPDRARCAGDRRHAPRPWQAALALAAAAGCGTGAQTDLIKTAVADNGERATAFEAAARTLDEHPEYVDEFYRVARRHPTTMRRFLEDTARDLRAPDLAAANAEILVAHPASLGPVLVATLDAAKRSPEARAAIDEAVTARAETMADILAASPAAVSRITDANVAAVDRRPPARTAFLSSLRRSAPRVAGMLKQDPETTKVLLGALVRQEYSPAASELLERLGLVK